MDSEPLPSIQQSIDAFRRDLPELLQNITAKLLLLMPKPVATRVDSCRHIYQHT